MIRRTLRLGIRLGLLAGIGLALFKLVQGRRSASEWGSPSPDWAPAPTPNPNLPKAPPEPELVTPVMFEELIEKKAAVGAAPPEVTIEPPPGPSVGSIISEPVVEKAAPAKRAPAKKVAPTMAPAAAGPVKKVVPKKVAAKKAAAPPTEAPPTEAPVAKKVAPVKKAPKKQP